MTELKIPAVGDSIYEVELVEWAFPSGAKVQEGDHVYTIASDKSNMEIEAPADGTLEILEKPGAILEIGQLVGRIL